MYSSICFLTASLASQPLLLIKLIECIAQQYMFIRKRFMNLHRLDTCHAERVVKSR
nr:MAG TPA: hypothetical protein [Caudoviricetes sp.]